MSPNAPSAASAWVRAHTDPGDRARSVGLAIAPGVGVGLAIATAGTLAVATDDPAATIATIEHSVAPRCVW